MKFIVYKLQNILSILYLIPAIFRLHSTSDSQLENCSNNFVVAFFPDQILFCCELFGSNI